MGEIKNDIPHCKLCGSDPLRLTSDIETVMCLTEECSMRNIALSIDDWTTLNERKDNIKTKALAFCKTKNKEAIEEEKADKIALGSMYNMNSYGAGYNSGLSHAYIDVIEYLTNEEQS